ncbi:MAG TPA: AEC family transporter [Casimicrobium huifangae]|uniref:AEC family transporter n=1 Tax=Casimicrobium huifangae TaxID=2591109 RepID=UPI0012EC2B6E|nr:AEC family transporter [Casimicrobium huifangae]HOB00029.1 AEC family transporter [Casimicrobium huifangae]HQD63761.1 AEC family transporter [Casimicrobium huifangae]
MALRIVEIVLPVLVIIVMGYAIGRLWNKPDMRVVNRLNLDVFGPFLVLANLSDKSVDLVSLWPLVVASIVIVIGSGLIAWPFAKVSRQDPRTFVPPMMFNNCGNMGLPLALFAFGPIGVAGMVALFTTSNLLHFTLGAFIVHKHAELKLLAKSPMVWATVIGAALGLTGTHLPDSVHAPMKMIGDCTIPVMLLSLGVRMLDVKREDFSNSLLGAAVCPLTGLLMAGIIVQYLPMSKEQIGLVYLFGALPPAVLNFLVADYYKQEPEKVASIVLVGNIASIVFIPLGLLFALK